ncbi:MAG: hypothetical protein HYY55_04200 [Candidatus Niyogibacteria bacterium]|nr:MAG: hypothetical protein HYY55_04200 [Candidatus Niyogibacteria bacterium]
MGDDERKLLTENLELSRKVLGIVKKMERRIFWQRALKTAKWVVIIALTILGFWQIQPYLNNVLNLYQGLLGTLNQTQGIQNNLPAELQKLLVQ